MPISRNPYVLEDGQPKLRKSVVAFIDILGYADLVQSAANASESQKLLRRLHGALRKARMFVDPEDSDDTIRKFTEKDLSAFRAFTDNIVIGYPIYDDAESELGNAFDELSYFQTTMSMEGFFVRGGIAIGDLYIDDIAVYGGGLMEAYEAETTLARDPRVVLAQSAQKAVDQHIGYYGGRAHAPQNSDLLKDADGQYFLDYMGTLVGDDGDVSLNDLTCHKERIEEKLVENKHRPAIWSKYLWAANYHNYFCAHCPGVDKSKRVATDDFSLKPARIVDSEKPAPEHGRPNS